MHTELCGSYIHLRKTQVLTSVSSLPKVPLLEMEEGNPQCLSVQDYKSGLASACLQFPQGAVVEQGH